MTTLPAAMIAASSAMILGQFWKIIRPLFSGRPPKVSAALQSGGMPSSHTAAAAALALVVGLRDGFASSLFALALVLTGVVAHDAVKVRGTINTLIRILRHMVPEEILDSEKPLPESVGHTPREVIAGFLLAAAAALLCHRMLPADIQ